MAEEDSATSAAKSYMLGIKRDAQGRGGSKYIFDVLRVGQTVKVSAPRNNSVLFSNTSDVVLIAGGLASLRLGFDPAPYRARPPL